MCPQGRGSVSLVKGRDWRQSKLGDSFAYLIGLRPIKDEIGQETETQEYKTIKTLVGEHQLPLSH